MSEKVLCEKSDLVAIADAVREATGSTENYNVSELSAATVEAISAGGGASVETCNVQITDASHLYAIAYMTVDANGNITAAFVAPSTNKQTITCLCGSVVAISHYKAATTSIKCTGCELLYCAGVSSTYGHSYIKVSCDAGETAVFTTGSTGTAGGSMD